MSLVKLFYQDSAAPEGKSEISIEKLESQLNTLKTMFAEKQKLVADLEAYGAGHGGGAPPAPAAAAHPVKKRRQMQVLSGWHNSQRVLQT